MNEATVRTLNALNRAFYDGHADEWQASRAHPWPGFRHVLNALPAAARTEPLRVLDVGAGDGRFGEFLSEQHAGALEYTGVDVSEPLIARGQQRKLAPGCRLMQADVLEDSSWLPNLQLAPQTLITVFGVMHHVPSLARRKALLALLAGALAPSGMLAVTFWRLHEDARFARRVVPWAAYNAEARQPIAEQELEPGDCLLGWGEQRLELGPVRYCHFAEEAEIQALIAASGLSLARRFLADGRGGALNDYVVLAR